jgi:hypothetical protein
MLKWNGMKNLICIKLFRLYEQNLNYYINAFQNIFLKIFWKALTE